MSEADQVNTVLTAVCNQLTERERTILNNLVRLGPKLSPGFEAELERIYDAHGKGGVGQ
jgi:hypothetical protein